MPPTLLGSQAWTTRTVACWEELSLTFFARAFLLISTSWRAEIMGITMVLCQNFYFLIQLQITDTIVFLSNSMVNFYAMFMLLKSIKWVVFHCSKLYWVKYLLARKQFTNFVKGTQRKRYFIKAIASKKYLTYKSENAHPTFLEHHGIFFFFF
jgi:hypothetical protein